MALAMSGLVLTVHWNGAGLTAWDVRPVIFVFGLGMGLIIPSLADVILGSVDERHAGAASGANNAVSRVAGLLGIAAVGAVIASQFGSSLDSHLAQRGPLPAAVQRAADDAKTRPLVGTHAEPAYRRTLGPAVDDASTTAFHTGMMVAALLVGFGGVISLVGIRDPRRPQEAPIHHQAAARTHA
jgi:hypothetical protein